MTLEITLITIAALVCIGIVLHHPSRDLGLPSLVIFLGVGLAFGNGGFDFFYDNLKLTSIVGSAALTMIVFVGGLNTSLESIRLAWKEGGVLSSFGVLLTTLIFAAMLYPLFDFNFITCLLFAAIASSTDAAAVFSILQAKKLSLKENTDTVLEFESATNDPVALLMVIILTGVITNGTEAVSGSEIAIDLVRQLVVGGLVGYGVAKLAVKVLNSITLDEYGLIPVFILGTFVIATYGSGELGGNVLIAAYIAGVVIRNQLKRGAEVCRHFYNALSWLAQSLMFVILGLQMFPEALADVFVISVIPALLLIFVARPIAVQLCYLPFTKASAKKRAFISFIGLKGATPIVFALIPAAAGVPGALEIMNMVFFIVLFSIFIQGGAIEPLANKLGLNEGNSKAKKH